MRAAPTQRRRRISFVLATLALASFATRTDAAPERHDRDNILILVIDDIGVEQIGAYGESEDPPPTPNIDRLAARGVLFRRAWAYSMCSPTRAALLTGRYGFRTGVGRITRYRRTDARIDYAGLDPAEITIPRLLAPIYESAAIGKWHLAGSRGGVTDTRHALRSGFGHFSGTTQNLASYYEWEKIVDGTVLTAPVTAYATSVTVDDASSRIRAMREPWLAYVAFHAAHVPIEPPPDDLHTQNLEGNGNEKRHAIFRAMIEALDREIGRLLAEIPEAALDRTTIFLIGDNGTSTKWRSDGRGKSTLYESGVRVPLIVAGPRIGPTARGRESAALVHAVDIFATVAEIARVEAPPTDSVSILPLLERPSRPSRRAFVYTEHFGPNGPPPYRRHQQVMRDQRYKLFRHECRDVEFYDLEEDPDERNNLLGRSDLPESQRRALARLRAELDALVKCRTDRDRDGVLDPFDNCLETPNPDQLDADGNGTGDACEAGRDEAEEGSATGVAARQTPFNGATGCT